MVLYITLNKNIGEHKETDGLQSRINYSTALYIAHRRLQVTSEISGVDLLGTSKVSDI